jgi:hypothetical protein
MEVHTVHTVPDMAAWSPLPTGIKTQFTEGLRCRVRTTWSVSLHGAECHRQCILPPCMQDSQGESSGVNSITGPSPNLPNFTLVVIEQVQFPNVVDAWLSFQIGINQQTGHISYDS